MNFCINLVRVVWLLLAFRKVFATRTLPEGNDASKEKGIVNPAVSFSYIGSVKLAIADLEFVKNEDNFPLFKPTSIRPICPIEEGGIFYVKNHFDDIEALNHAGELICHYYFQPSIEKKEDNMPYAVGYEIHTSSRQLNNENLFLKLYEGMKPDEKRWSYWYLIYDVEFDHDTLSAEYVTHTVFARMHSDNYAEKCPDYYFGQRVVGQDIGVYYEESNQNALFESLGISTTSPPPYGYFVEHLLAPIQDNVNEVVRSGLCSYLNTTPLWQTVSEGSVRKVEEFIRKVADIVGFVEVRTTVLGKLQFPNDVYLDSNSRKIPVPRIVRKSLYYDVRVNTFKRKRYSLSVFIHNEPTTERIKNEMCDESVCEKYGWDFGIGDVDIGWTYCCFSFKPSTGSYYSPVSDTEPFDLNTEIPLRTDFRRFEYVNVSERLKEDKSGNR